MMNLGRTPPFIAAMFACFLILHPEPGPADTDMEINHLIGFIGQSDCLFIRNGKAYDAERARRHIETKLNAARRWIKTAEDFIDYAATKSSVSGKPYKVRCGDREMFCSDWLRTELARFRKAR